MKSLLELFSRKEEKSNKKGILNNPGDKLEAKITKSDRQVIKIHKNKGKNKYSATRYPNGTTVETKVTKK